MNKCALQVKTGYSILHSLIKIKNLVKLAKEYGYTSLAITDENNMFGVMEFYNECKNNDIKPIIGIELSFDNSKLLLYAKNEKGYKNLIKLSTLKSKEELDINVLKEYNDNLILIMPFSFFNEEIFNLYENKYIGYYNDESVKSNKIKLYETCYLYEEEYTYLDYAKMIEEGKVLGEYELNKDKFKYLRKDLEYNKEEQEIIDYIVESCNLEITHKDGLLPVYDKNINAKEHLNNLSHKGLLKRLNNNVPNNYKERLEYELNVIDKMGFNDYFLIVYDYVLYAKKNNILVGPGRGSAAGSLVSYSLGITEIDPLKYDLLFERFLNIERVTMPDIDIDFDANKRQEVIEYVINKYGLDHVAGIITFNTLGAKQVLRDVGRVLKISGRQIDTISKLCTSDLLTSYNENERLKKLITSSEEIKKLYKIATHLEGLPRHISIHAAGIVMSSHKLVETIPLYKTQMDTYITGYSKDYLEPLGLLKMDFLGLSNLTMIDEIIKNIREFEKINITFNNIPEEDKKTFNLFSNDDLEGIFQFESPGIKNFIKKLNPQNFLDLVSAISLYRPGTTDLLDEYLLRRNNKKKIDYFTKELEPILKETYGIITYQEQIMQIARVIAGYTLGESDILRRAISKKKEEVLIKEKEKFISSSIKNGYTKELAQNIYDLILKFANYGFNKSHAVAYAMISYKMAFLKTYFYKYFMLSLLNNSINDEEKLKEYIKDIRKKNIEIIKPSINLSETKFILKDNLVVCPLTIIKNLGINISSSIIKERENAKYKSFIDFVTRLDKRLINKKTLTSLILSGVFDEFNYNKNTLINNIDNILNYVSLTNDKYVLEEPIIDEYPELSESELIKNEFITYGFYLTNHPVIKYRENLETTLSLPKYENKFIIVVLEIISIKEITTKNNDIMAFIKAEDEFTQIDLTLFPKVYKSNSNLEIYDIIKIYGRVEKRFDKYQIVVSTIKKLN